MAPYFDRSSGERPRMATGMHFVLEEEIPIRTILRVGWSYLLVANNHLQSWEQSHKDLMAGIDSARLATAAPSVDPADQ